MSSFTSPQSTALGRRVATAFDYAVHYSFEIFLAAIIIYLCISRGLTLNLEMYDPLPSGQQEQVHGAELSMGNIFTMVAELPGQVSTMVASFTGRDSTSVFTANVGATVAIDAQHSGFNEVARTDDPAPHISNLTLVLSPDYGERKGLPRNIIAAKKARVQNYLKRYAAAAQAEMKEFGIPASITLAQGLLESNAGDSKLARVSNNHFGIKCRAKCLGCTCRNYGDDTRYDMFRVFDSAADSFREHSKLLNYPRYRKLKNHGTDYVKWSHGLKACGYATDKRYGHKLVTIIENLGLDRYDRI